MFPSAHHVSVVLVDQAATDEDAENAPPHQRLHTGKHCSIKP
ncbi:MAG: hypothetical protein ACYC2E_03945 [Sulfuricella sp.]